MPPPCRFECHELSAVPVTAGGCYCVAGQGSKRRMNKLSLSSCLRSEAEPWEEQCPAVGSAQGPARASFSFVILDSVFAFLGP